MTPGDKPLMALVKVPMPVPSVVLVERETVGLAVVPQQTPRAVIGEPPSSVMVPPLVAVVEETEEAIVVVIVDITAGALKVICSP